MVVLFENDVCVCVIRVLVLLSRMLIAWNGRGVVLDRGWSVRGGDCPVVPGFIDLEICCGRYGICGCR